MIFVCGTAGRLYRSVDQAATWRPLFSPTSEDLLSMVSIPPETIVACGKRQTVIRTTNRGVSWDPVVLPPARDEAVDQDGAVVDLLCTSVLEDVVVCCGSHGTCLISFDRGMTWNRKVVPLTSGGGGGCTLSSCVLTPDRGLLCFPIEHGACFQLPFKDPSDVRSLLTSNFIAHSFLKEGIVRAACRVESSSLSSSPRVLVYGIQGRVTNYDFTTHLVWDPETDSLQTGEINFIPFVQSGKKNSVNVVSGSDVVSVVVRSCSVGIMKSVDGGNSFDAPVGVDTGAALILSPETIISVSRNHVFELHTPTSKTRATRVDAKPSDQLTMEEKETKMLMPTTRRLNLKAICSLPKMFDDAEANAKSEAAVIAKKKALNFGAFVAVKKPKAVDEDEED
eukprot:PhM_4_TR8258/c0_g1_i1/m.49326